MENSLSKEEMVNIISESIKRIEEKTFNVYFYVFDSKGVPNGMLEYIYTTALQLKKLGYNVSMLHNEEDEFVGVTDWMGEEYSFPHKNVVKDNVQVGAYDFLFIPEVLSNVMIKTKSLPCKRVIICQNHRYLVDFMPIEVDPHTLKINDCITTTNNEKNIINNYFNNLRVQVVRPSIKKYFRPNTSARKLIVNIVSRDINDANLIVKPFYWKYPMFRWVTFRNLNGVKEDLYAESLRDAAITICVDDKSNFGYNIIDAVSCGSVVMAKVPEIPSDWMVKEDGKLDDSIIWFNDINKVTDMVANIVNLWIRDEIPSDVYECISNGYTKFSQDFSEEKQLEDIKEVYVKNLFERRLNEFNEVKKQVENNVIK